MTSPSLRYGALRLQAKVPTSLAWDPLVPSNVVYDERALTAAPLWHVMRNPAKTSDLQPAILERVES